jgi:hypothetical protein
VRQCCPRFELAIGERKAKREMSPREALFRALRGRLRARVLVAYRFAT